MMAGSSELLNKNLMHPIRWIPADTTNLLDAGCNTGDLLRDLRLVYPKMRLVGIDLNAEAIEIARKTHPTVEFHLGTSHILPFDSGSFDCITCIEVIEHVPARFRAPMLAEFNRVLRRGGRLVLRCPHAGAFGWLDAQNIRFQVPWLYRAIVGKGMRDEHYDEAGGELVYHHHFTREELLQLAGAGWEVDTCRRGGLLLFPVMDFLAYPFYRKKKIDGPVFAAIHKVAALDLGVNYGPLSYDILLVLKKA